MIKNNAIFDDLAKLASGAAGSAMEMKREIEAMVTAKIEQMVGRMGLVSREEFEIVQEIASKALKENDILRNELDGLKQSINSLVDKNNQK
jgi:BMFP domain-containing protein YqiC